MTTPLRWTGTHRGQVRQLEVPRAPEPFTTDLASAPRILTWLLPGYGKYTKAAVLHDYLCQRFGADPADRARDALLIYPLTLLCSPLLAIGGVLGAVLFGFLAVEDACRGFPQARRILRDLRSEEAKAEKLGTPQFARLAAVMES